MGSKFLARTTQSKSKVSASQMKVSPKRRKAVSNAVEFMEKRVLMSSVFYWNFGTTASMAGVTSVTPANSNITAGNFSVGQPYGTVATGITTTSASSGYTTANGVAATGQYNIGSTYNTGNATLSTSVNPYYTVTLTPAAGYKLEVDGYSFGSRSTSTGPTTLTLLSSIDGFTTPLETNTIPVTGTWTASGTASLTQSVTGNSGSAIELRLYLSGNSATASGTAVNNRVDDVSITATAVAVTPPNITSVVPYGGTIAGGNSVVITGSGFDNANLSGGGVTFGGMNASSYVVNSDSQITAVAPAESAGTVDVRVTVLGEGTSSVSASDHYTFTTAPVVAHVSPASGITYGGTTVTITGTNFTGATSVMFGSNAATNVLVGSGGTSITATDPAGALGAVDVTVMTPQGTSQTNGASAGGADTFTYVAPTTIANLEAMTTGTQVTLNDHPVVTYVINSTPGTVNSTKTFTTATYIVSDGTGSLEVSQAAYNASAGTGSTYTPTVGDTVTVSGTYTIFDGIPEISTVTAASKVSTATPPADPVPNPTITQTSTIVSGTGASSLLANNISGYVVTLKGVEVSFPASTGTSFTQNTATGTITDETGNSEELFYYPTSFLTSLQNLYLASYPSGLVDVTGIASLYTSGTTTVPQFIPLSIVTSANLPVVSSVSPMAGPLGGGNSVTVSGYGFNGSNYGLNDDGSITVAPVTTVYFGGVAGTNVSVLNDNTLTVTPPAEAAGAVDVTVVNGNGQSLPTSTAATPSNADVYTFTTAPVITSVVPNSANFSNGVTTNGTSSVIITGLNFTGVPATGAVKFGTLNATYVVNSATQITATAPADPGITMNTTVDITITGGGMSGTSTTQVNDHFIYVLAPSITTISPGTGAVSGGYTLTITGANFVPNITADPNDTVVTVGGVAATNVVVNASGGTLTATVPSGSLGTTDVVVTTAGGKATDAGSFTYIANNIAAAEGDASGTLVVVNSNPVITAIVSSATIVNTVTYTKYGFFLQDSTGSLEVFSVLPSNAPSGYVPAVGDVVNVSGTYAPFDAIPEISTLTSITVVSQGAAGTASAAPHVLTVAQINSQQSGATLVPGNNSNGSVAEYLVTINDATIAPGTLDSTNAAATTFGTLNLTGTISDGSGSTITLYYYVTSYSGDQTGLTGPGYSPLYGTTIPTGPVDITGFVDVYTSGTSSTTEFNPLAITPYVATGPTRPVWFSGGTVNSYTPGVNGVGGSANLSGGTIIANPAASGDGGLALTDSGTTYVNLSSGSATVQFGSVSISTTSVLALRPAATGALSAVTPLLLTSGLTLNGTAVLDLANGFLDVPGGNLATISAEVKEGFNNGAWNAGTTGGIDSSVAAANSTHLTALGSIINNNGTSTPLLTSFDGTSPGASDVLVAYTYYGDADLSGKVDASDYSRIDANFALTTRLSGWYNGDFNYDGVINGSDYTLIDNAFNTQGTPLPAAVIAPASKATHTAVAIPPVATPDSIIFSDKKVKESLADQIEDLITG